MNLPVIARTTFSTNLPSNNTEIRLRPFLTKEEKVLLIAKESGDYHDIMIAVKDVVKACIETKDIDVNKLPMFDVEWLFVRLRAMSVSPSIELSFRDNEDNEVRKFKVPLDDVKMVMPDKDYSKIQVNDKIAIVLRYPEASLYNDKTFANVKGEKVFEELTLKCIHKITDGDSVSSVESIPKDALKVWIDSLPVTAYDDIKKFFNNLPHLEYATSYKNKNDREVSIRLETLNDFFQLV